MRWAAALGASVPRPGSGDVTMGASGLRFSRRGVLADGNSQFRALSDQLFDSERFHRLVR